MSSHYTAAANYNIHFTAILLCNAMHTVSALLSVGQCMSVRPFVCLSITLVYYIKTAKDVIILFSWPYIPSLWFLEAIQGYPIPRGTTTAGALNTWVGKCDSWLKLPFIPEMYDIGPWCCGALIGNHRYLIDPCHSDDLDWPWKTGCNGKIFQENPWFDLERPNLAR